MLLHQSSTETTLFRTFRYLAMTSVKLEVLWMAASFLLMFVPLIFFFFFCLSFFEIVVTAYLPLRTFLLGSIYATALLIQKYTCGISSLYQCFLASIRGTTSTCPVAVKPIKEVFAFKYGCFTIRITFKAYLQTYTCPHL